MVLMVASLISYCYEIRWDLLMLTCLETYLEMQMESYLIMMLEQIWSLQMYPLMIINMESMGGYLFKTHWGILIVKCLALMKA